MQYVVFAVASSQSAGRLDYRLETREQRAEYVFAYNKLWYYSMAGTW